MARKYTGKMTATMRRTKPPRAERMIVLRRDLEAVGEYVACFSERKRGRGERLDKGTDGPSKASSEWDRGSSR